jgi:hypothetical protein
MLLKQNLSYGSAPVVKGRVTRFVAALLLFLHQLLVEAYSSRCFSNSS